MSHNIDDPRVCVETGKKLADGVFVEVDTAADDGRQTLGQLIGEPDENGIWKYRYIGEWDGREYVGLAGHHEMARYVRESKQTDAARATRRRLRAMGFRIRNSWGDGLVQMARPDGIWIVVKLDGKIKPPTSEQCFQAMVEMINEGLLLEGMTP